MTATKLIVKVIDVDDMDPVFTKSEYVFKINESVSIIINF